MCDDPNIEHTHTRETERHTDKERDRQTGEGTLRTLRKLSSVDVRGSQERREGLRDRDR